MKYPFIQFFKSIIVNLTTLIFSNLSIFVNNFLHYFVFDIIFVVSLYHETVKTKKK